MSQILYTPEEQKEILKSYWGIVNTPMNLDFFLSNMEIVFRKSKRSFIKSKFYADLGMDGEYLAYAYSPSWSERLAQMENGYAYYNVLVTAGLKTKAEFNLYLSMLPYLSYGESPWLSYDSNLPDIYCVKEGKYADPKDINKRLVKPSVKGVSIKTDIKISEIKKKKEGRKVVALKFMLEENSQQFLGADNEDIVPALHLNHPTVKMIHKAFWGLESTIAQWIADHGELAVKQGFEHVQGEVRNRSKENLIKSPFSYLAWYLTNKPSLVKTGEEVLAEHQEEVKAEQERKLSERQKNAQKEQEERAAHSALVEQQREERKKAQTWVEAFLSALGETDKEQLEAEFVKETNLKSNDIQAFHDWIAEKEDLGNPYPWKRVERMKSRIVGA